MQNRILVYIFVFFSISIFSCRKEFKEEIGNSQKPVEAVTKMPLYYPLKQDTNYIYLSEDYELIKVTATGDFIVMNDISEAFPDLPDLNTRYKYIQLFYSNDSTQFIINTLIEDITNDTYFSAKVIKLDMLGNIISDEQIDFPTLDSSLSINFDNHWISKNKYTWIFSAQGKGQNRDRLLYAIQYDINNQSTTDTSFVLASRGDIIYEIKENNKLYEFSFAMNTTFTPFLKLHVLNENLAVIDSANYNINIDIIHFSRKLSNGNYFISGSNSNFLSEVANPYDVTAEIDLKGNVIYARQRKFADETASVYFYYNDIIETSGDSLIMGGYYAIDWGYYDITKYTSSTLPSTAFAYVVGSTNQNLEHLINATYNKLGLSSTIAINKASYGYTALVYYTEYSPNTDSYLWLLKYDQNLNPKTFDNQ